MKTRLLKLCAVILTATVLVTLFLRGTVRDNSEPVFIRHQEAEQEDDMERAYRHEWLMTRDPATNRIPVERLIAANDKMDEITLANPLSRVNSLAWQERGPSNIGGRTRGLLVDRSDVTGNTVFAAGVGGGLWKTTNFKSGSPTWTAINNFFGNLAITCIKQSPVNVLEMYFGTGEGWGNIDAIDGLGIWKSTDGGNNWSQLSSTTGLSYVEDLEFDNNGYIYASTRSTNSALRGILRSTDNGVNWTQVLTDPTATTTRGADLERAADGDMYATLGIFSTGHIFRSPVNGVNTGISGSWTEITPAGITSNAYQRVEIAVCPSAPATIYAIAQDDASSGVGALYRSDNDGGSWTTLANASWCDQGASTNNDFSRGQAWYDLILGVDPNNSATVLAGGVVVVKSTNSGTSWSQFTRWTSGATCTSVPVIHADIHEIMFLSSTELIIGTDGGIYYSNDGGASFSTKNAGYNVTQYYGMAVSAVSGSNSMIAGSQDNGSHLFSSSGVNSVSSVTGGDGGFSFIDATNSAVWITSNPGGFFNIYRSNGTYLGTAGSGDGRFVAPGDYASTINTLYYCDGDGLYGRVFNVESGSASYGTINIGTEMGANRQVSCVKVDPADETVIWLGCSESENNTGAAVTPSLVKVIRANGPSSGMPSVKPSATAFAGPALPAGSYISNIDIESGNSNHMILSVANFGTTSVWESTDGGTNWTSVEGNLPDMPVRWAMFIPSGYIARTAAIGGVLLGTELGAWSTSTLSGGSTTWMPNNTGFANVRVDQLVLRQSDKLVGAATHGRGVFTSTLLTAPLPVELTSFTGSLQNRNAILRWTTASEYNSKHFELERSLDGNSGFRKIATIPAAGFSNGFLNYSFLDKEPLSEYNFYRLRSVDLNNKEELSQVILVKLPNARQDMYVLGNPITDQAVIRFVKIPQQKITVTLYDLSGKLMAQKQFDPSSSQDQFIISTGKLGNGIYVLKAQVGDETFIKRVIK
jgi:hypothetical protein